jgi:gas vesicle protein
MSIIGFGLGLSAGLGIGMLFAPRAGVKTRCMIRKRAMNGVAYVKQQTDDAREGAEELLKASRKMARQSDAVQAALTAGKYAYRKVAMA